MTPGTPLVIATWSPAACATSFAALTYLALMLSLINCFAWRAATGRPLALWQASLAELPLRWLGYGGVRGRPLCEACCRRAVRLMVAITIGTSAIAMVLTSIILLGMNV